RAVVARARKVRLLVMDVDGVLTDGRMILSERGDELKAFNTHDGLAIALAKRAGIRTAMVTGESSPIAKARGAKLGVDSVVLGAQKVVSVVVTAAGGIALARLLTPEVFGLYAILIFVITLGVRFSELGLGAALIQRRDLDLTTGLSGAFTATFVLALVLGAAIMTAAPLVARWPGVSSEVAAPVRWLALLVVLSSLRMPAMVLLERRL